MPNHTFSAIAGAEASMTLVVLPRCANCGDKHPKAHNPPLRQSDCPTCGAEAGTPGEPIDVNAHLSFRGWAAHQVRALLGIGKWFRDLSKRI